MITKENDMIDFGKVEIRKLPMDAKPVTSSESSVSGEFRDSGIQKYSKEYVKCFLKGSLPSLMKTC